MPKFIDFKKEHEAKEEAWRRSPQGKKWLESSRKRSEEFDRAYSDPAKKPYKGMIWNPRKKRWGWIPLSAAARLEEKRRRLEEKRRDEKRRKIWADIENRIPPGWGGGVACDLGWKEIVLNLTRDLDRLWNGFGGHPGRDCWVPLQVKEKFGSLRYYIESGFQLGPKDSKRIHDEANWRSRLQHLLINEAESESLRTCERCGTRLGGVERRSVGGWIGTVCPEHYQEWLMGRFKEEKKRNPKFEIHELMDGIEKKKVAAKADFKTP